MPEIMSRASAILSLVLALLVLPSLAHAQTAEPKRSPFGIAAPSDSASRELTGERPTAGAPAASPGVLDRAWGWVLEQQNVFRMQMSAAVRAMKEDPFGAGFLTIVFAGFLYGVIHAVGPGHGKGVVSSYVLANHQTVRRGVVLAFLSAFIQALSAISIFAVLSLLLNARKQEFDTVEAWLATASWGMVAAIGAWLVWRQVRPLISRIGTRSPAAAAPAHAHAHAHHGHARHAHDHDHGRHAHAPKDHDCDCGHAHIPAAGDLEGPWSWRHALALAIPVGLRPCTGALGMLALTTLNGLFWVGVAATLAMSLGTAITISAIAAAAVGSRDLAKRVAGGDGLWASRISIAAGLAGAVALFVLGTAFFFASLHGAAPI